MDELLELSGHQFEDQVVEFLTEKGYRDVERVGGAGDLGVDIVCRDSLDRRVAVQCKRFAPGRTIGSPLIQLFFGMVVRRRAERGLYVTTSSYTQPARKLALELDIDLIDGSQLARHYRKKREAERRREEEQSRPHPESGNVGLILPTSRGWPEPGPGERRSNEQELDRAVHPPTSPLGTTYGRRPERSSGETHNIEQEFHRAIAPAARPLGAPSRKYSRIANVPPRNIPPISDPPSSTSLGATSAQLPDEIKRSSEVTVSQPGWLDLTLMRVIIVSVIAGPAVGSIAAIRLWTSHPFWSVVAVIAVVVWALTLTADHERWWILDPLLFLRKSALDAAWVIPLSASGALLEVLFDRSAVVAIFASAAAGSVSWFVWRAIRNPDVDTPDEPMTAHMSDSKLQVLLTRLISAWVSIGLLIYSVR